MLFIVTKWENEMATSKSQEIAQKIVDTANRLRWNITIRGNILVISKKFTPGDNEGLITCDMEYYDILSLLPSTSSGSIWGTDCGGIGAISALKSGNFVMNKSGGSTRVLNALKKIL
jgi:hypothetical protein